MYQLSWFLTFIWIIGCKCTRYANSEYNKTIHYKETSLNHFQHSFIYYRLSHYTMAWLQVVKSQIVITMVQYSRYQLGHDSLDNNKLIWIDDLLIPDRGWWLTHRDPDRDQVHFIQHKDQVFVRFLLLHVSLYLVTAGA